MAENRGDEEQSGRTHHDQQEELKFCGGEVYKVEQGPISCNTG
jgi:hypothetical protein